MLFMQFYRVCSLRWLMKITFTVHLFRFCSVLEWKLTTSVKDADCQNLSLKTSDSQQNMERGLFLHRAHYIGQSGFRSRFSFPAKASEEPCHWSQHVTSVTHGDLRSASLLYALKYVSMLSCSSNLHCLLVHSLSEAHSLGKLPFSSHLSRGPTRGRKAPCESC